MEIRKTTLLSFLVCVAGILAEIIFRDVLVKSAFGVVLSVLLAVVILVLAYFFYDGLFSFLAAEREMDKKRQEGYDQKLYAILNEQLQFEKAIYKEVHVLMQESEDMDKAEGVSVRILEECLKRLEASVNEHTTTTAKIVSKYVNHNMDETRTLFEQNKSDLQAIMEGQEALGSMRDNIRLLLEKQPEPAAGVQDDIRTLLERQAVLGQVQDDIQLLLKEQAALGQAQADIQATLKEGAASGQEQEEIKKLAESQKELAKTQKAIQRRLVVGGQGNPELSQMQNDIRTILSNESELKQSQGEMQSSIRKLAEILSVLLSLMRRKKADTEKS